LFFLRINQEYKQRGNYRSQKYCDTYHPDHACLALERTRVRA
jgi:hypothetical protein